MKYEDQTIFRAVNYIPKFNAAHKECSEYPYSQVCLPERQFLKTKGKELLGKGWGEGVSPDSTH